MTAVNPQTIATTALWIGIFHLKENVKPAVITIIANIVLERTNVLSASTTTSLTLVTVKYAVSSYRNVRFAIKRTNADSARVASISISSPNALLAQLFSTA